MPQRHVPRHAQMTLVLLLLLTAPLAGAALGHFILPPGRLGLGEDLVMSGVQVQAMAAASQASSSNRPVEQFSIGSGQFRSDLSGSDPSPFSIGSYTRDPTWKSPSLPAESSLKRTHDWRLELQVGPSWQYAAGAGSREIRAPNSAPIGEPR